MSSQLSAALAEARRVVVRYGATIALDGVDLQVCAGEVHALVGENGAGKSTLLRAIAANIQPTSGSIELAATARLAWVPQETILPADLTVVEWIFLGCELRGPLGVLRRKAMHEAARAVLDEIGARIAPSARLGSLPLPHRKQVQLARALRGTPNLLLLDEPTAVLGAADTSALFSTVRQLRQRGAGVLYVSHRLDEVLAIADRVTVLRDGQVVSAHPIRGLDAATLVQRMVGRDIPAQQRDAREHGAVLLDVTDVSVAHVDRVSLNVRCGEVVGLAGLVGAGRSELIEAVANRRPLRGGQVRCSAPPILVPEDRSSKGLVGELCVRDNLFLPADGWLLHRSRERSVTQQWIERLHIRARGSEARIESLSGGNQQKLLLARALRHRPQVLLLDEPTAGVDVAAKVEIHEVIRQLARDGTAILLASSDLPELLLLCDRVVALRLGRVAGMLSAEEASEARLAALITGAAPA